MKTMSIRLTNEVGDELDTIEVDNFTIADEPQEIYSEYVPDNQEIIERVEDLYTSVLTLLSERQAVPRQGRTWLKLALGEAVLTADQKDGDIVLQIVVRPFEAGEDDAIPAP